MGWGGGRCLRRGWDPMARCTARPAAAVCVPALPPRTPWGPSAVPGSPPSPLRFGIQVLRSCHRTGSLIHCRGLPLAWTRAGPSPGRGCSQDAASAAARQVGDGFYFICIWELGRKGTQHTESRGAAVGAGAEAGVAARGHVVCGADNVPTGRSGGGCLALDKLKATEPDTLEE